MFRAIYRVITGILDFIKNYFFILLALVFILSYIFAPQNQKVASANLIKIDIVGPIFQSSQFLKKINEANKKNIKGVLVYINSPGGLVAPSVEMSYAIKRLTKKKPVVVYAAGTMASGSYYAGIWANKIVANPGSIIGSIGVIFDGYNISELIKKLGIKEQTVKMGKYKEAGTFLRAWNKDEKEELNRVLKNTYNMFVKDVAKARKLKVKDQDKFANAHIFTAYKAKQVGLIDRVGTIYEAEQELMKLSGITKPKWKKRDKFEKYLDKILDEAMTKVSTYFGGLQSYLP